MKKIFFPGVFLALMLIFSCSKNEFTESDATQAQKDVIGYQDSIDQVRDSLNMIGGIIQYSVSVIPVDAETDFVSGGFKSADGVDMLTGAVVSVSQHGIVKKDSTDDSGMAVFHDLRVGTINVNVQAEGYTDVSFVAEIRPENDPNVNIYYDVLRHAANMIPVFALGENTASVSGQVTLETDLTNTDAEIAEGVTVIATLDISNDAFSQKYLSGGYMSEYAPTIIQAAYTDLTVNAVTDDAGEYSIEIPSSATGLPYKVTVSDYVADQQILLKTLRSAPVWGTQTIRTLFSTEYTTASTIPYVKPAYVEFSAPTGSIAQQPITQAAADAVVGESGIASIIIRSQGAGYTQAPFVNIISNYGSGAEAIAYISEGKVTEIEITNPGKGYAEGDVDVELVDLVDDNGTWAVAYPVITYGITKYTITNPGTNHGYESTPEVVITSNSGSGASAQAVMTGFVPDGSIELTDMGSGYVCPPNVTIDASTGSSDNGSDAEASADMTDYNPIHSITLSDEFINDPANQYETTPDLEIRNVGGGVGSGATGIVNLSNAGRVLRIELTDAGSGYEEAPTVLITGGGGMGAVAYATINAGSISNIVVAEHGTGYTSDPTVTITPPNTGTQATAVAVRDFQISSITLTNPGDGYNILYNTGDFDDNYTNEPEILIDGIVKSSDFTNDSWITVRPNMSIEAINVDANGFGYETIPNVTITPSCGYGSGAEAVVTKILYNVAAIEVVNEGSGYEYNANINVTVVTPPEGCLTQALVSNSNSNLLGNGKLTGIEIENQGDYYLAPPHVVLEPDFTFDNPEMSDDAEIEAVVSNGKIIAYNIINPGAGYKYSATPITSFNALQIDTYWEEANIDPEAYPESGKIAFVTIDQAGEGYTVTPLVRFIRGVDINGDPVSDEGFVAAQAEAVVEDGRVVAINITNPGTGYYDAPDVEIYIPDELEVARGICDVNADGYIVGVDLVDADGNPVIASGIGYSEVPTVTFTPAVAGMGSGATANAVIENGAVINVVMTNNGSGYLGKNYPGPAPGAADMAGNLVTFGSTGAEFMATAGKSYIVDIDLGTGLRTIDD